MDDGVFRREALERQGERLWGDLILAQPLSLRLMSAFLVFVALVFAVFLCLNDYSRRQAVQGYLVPDRGMVEVNPPQAGRLLRLAVARGQTVQAGDLLFEVQVDRRDGGGGNGVTSAAQLRELERQAEGLAQRRQQEVAQRERLRRRFAERWEELEAELAGLRALQGTEGEMLALKRRAEARGETLHQRGVLALAELDLLREQRLAQERSLERLGLEEARTTAALRDLTLEREQAEYRVALELESLDTQHSELAARRLALQAGHSNRVSAPVDGVVADLSASPGQLVDPAVPVLSLIPAQSTLEAEFLVPSRAVGFLAPGQTVELRYDAFPYQTFGVHPAVVREVAGGLAVHTQGAGQEPLFRARARLARQDLSAYGARVPLRPGMLLSADVVVEERNLLAWLLDPLLSLR